MELFDKNCVYFEWDDILDGAICFCGEDIETIKKSLRKENVNLETVIVSKDDYTDEGLPKDSSYRFVYFDPHYVIKKAFLEGKTIQYIPNGRHNYTDITSEWELDNVLSWCKYIRVKPDEDYRPFISCEELIEFWSCLINEIANCKLLFTKLENPSIWVKEKSSGSKYMITGYSCEADCNENDGVFLGDMWIDMNDLFEKYTFLDDTPCGILLEPKKE